MEKKSVPDVFQLKVGLQRMKPPVWRRIQVLSDTTFHQLSRAINDAFGWNETHLHQFIFNFRKPGEYYVMGRENRDQFVKWHDEKKERLADHLTQPGMSKATYEYDFGDSWMHDVLLEKKLPAEEGASYPKCIAGTRPNPPEDAQDEEWDDWEDSDEKFKPADVEFRDAQPFKKP